MHKIVIFATFVIASFFFSCVAKSEEKPKKAELPTSVDLRPHFEKWELPRRNQEGRGTCSVFTIVGAIEYAVGKRDGRSEQMSVEFANWAKNRTGGGKWDGGFFSAIWAGTEEHGFCAENLMPYQQKYDPNVIPSDEAIAAAKATLESRLYMHWVKQWDVRTGLTDAQFDKIKSTLASETPVCLGLRWPKKARWENDVMQYLEPEHVFDGHSILFVGYHDDATISGGGYFIYRNTNNPKREEMMSYEYAKHYANDAVYIDTEPEKSE